MTSNYPVSDEVFRYLFESEQVSNKVCWIDKNGVPEYLDKTTESHEQCVNFHKSLNAEEKLIFSTLQGFGIAFTRIPHDLEIQDLYPMLCDVERVMRKTFQLSREELLTSEASS